MDGLEHRRYVSGFALMPGHAARCGKNAQRNAATRRGKIRPALQASQGLYPVPPDEAAQGHAPADTVKIAADFRRLRALHHRLEQSGILLDMNGIMEGGIRRQF
nr:hypothetical protein [uncultured Desulfovibrio sp.]